MHDYSHRGRTIRACRPTPSSDRSLPPPATSRCRLPWTGSACSRPPPRIPTRTRRAPGRTAVSSAGRRSATRSPRGLSPAPSASTSPTPRSSRWASEQTRRSSPRRRSPRPRAPGTCTERSCTARAAAWTCRSCLEPSRRAAPSAARTRCWCARASSAGCVPTRCSRSRSRASPCAAPSGSGWVGAGCTRRTCRRVRCSTGWSACTCPGGHSRRWSMQTGSARSGSPRPAGSTRTASGRPSRTRSGSGATATSTCPCGTGPSWARPRCTGGSPRRSTATTWTGWSTTTRTCSRAGRPRPTTSG